MAIVKMGIKQADGTCWLKDDTKPQEKSTAWLGGWFVGESELDPGQTGFDGTVWCKPTTPDDEPYLIAEHIEDKQIAQVIAASPELLAACQKALTFAESAICAGIGGPKDLVDYALETHPLLVELRRVIAKATGKK